VLSLQLDLIILKLFSKVNDSMILSEILTLVLFLWSQGPHAFYINFSTSVTRKERKKCTVFFFLQDLF